MTCGGFYTIIFARLAAVRKEGEKKISVRVFHEKIGHILASRRGTKLNSFFTVRIKCHPEKGRKMSGGQKKAFSCFQFHAFK